ncbi:MAG: DUF5689 domain-containing protein [Luteibaculaceae bacterium]
MNKFFLNQILLAVFAIIALAGCRKLEWDTPPLRTIPEGDRLTIQQLRALHTGQRLRFNDDRTVFAVVTMDEENGNLFRNVFIQDHTGAINMRLTNPGGLFQGDSLRINLRGTSLSIFNGMMQLDSVSVIDNIVKQANLVDIPPLNVTLDQINPALQGQLVRINDVEIIDSDLNRTWADGINRRTENRIIRDCEGNQFLVRTSGFSNFAGVTVPQGRGSIVGVISQFNNDLQLFIRSMEEVKMDGERCGAGPCPYNVPPVNSLSADFSGAPDNVDFNDINWINVATQGSRVWRGRTFSGNSFVRGTSFNSFDPVNEQWLITRPINYNGVKYLSFRSAKNSGNDPFHDALSVWVSSDFDGCDVEGSTWVEVTGYTKPTGATPNNSFVESGSINLSPFVTGGSGTIHVAFRYLSSFPAGQTTGIDVDDVNISDTPQGGGGGGGGGGGPTVLLNQTFEDHPVGSGGTIVPVNLTGWVNTNPGSGNDLWHVRSFASNRHAEFSSHFSTLNVSDEVWLITAPLNFATFTTKTLSFDVRTRFWANPQLQVFISENFDGTVAGIPSATWVPLAANLPNNETTGFVSTGNIDLSSYTGSNVRIAFKYTGTGGGNIPPGNNTTYQLDNINVTAQ